MTEQESDFTADYHIDCTKPSVDEKLRIAWQKIVDMLAEVTRVPAALVMQIHPTTIEVFSTSNSESANPYERGETADLGNGLYCETVLRSQAPLLVSNALADPDWDHNPDIELGMIFYYGVPILWPDDTSFGTLCILDNQEHQLDDWMRDLIHVLKTSIESGLKILYMQQQRLQATLQLNQVLESTIMALVSTLACRDPYTAQHQKRVADLTVRIAVQMGLDSALHQGLYLGAAIHDVGKIYVPSDILNRPGKLSVAEFEIIKSHPMVGAQIVKDIAFPWPIQDLILQHHERLDGSGYPAGLVGDQILLEARILSVADVVEAMSSHRPYRSALGLDAALDVVRSGRGILYDADVVDACLLLFEQQQYRNNWDSKIYADQRYQ
ncbi:HD domain-containing phosphohydrolase [Spirulina major]|uniref:HD domain-containing phosphohydrolase n=1 Tax=Spirulina major TaxID=270636 RepID=UPI0009FDEE41|nr:HD domain-containing phosphohydrolase [Spirulina major]